MSDTEAEPSMEVQPLQALFARAQELFAQAEGGSAPAVNAGIYALRCCADAVDRLALFSSNEEADDLATPDLKYLSIPYLHAELRTRCAATDMQERMAALQESKQHYSWFLHRLQQYGMLEARCAEAFDRLEAGERVDPTTTRASKIALYKMERDLNMQMETLTQRRMASRRAAELHDEGEDGGGAVAVDEEAEREAWLLQLDVYAVKAVQQLAATEQELQLLDAAAMMPQAERRAAARSNAPPPELLRQLQVAAVGLDSRSRIQRNLLRPSHNLPTRTLAQQAEIEMKQAHEAAERQQEAEAVRAAKGSDDEDDDEAVFRQRAMDDWKDEHPTGYGNSKLRPTA